VLGSSDYGAQVAAHFGLPFCFAHFITDGAGAEAALDLYRAGYRPSPRHPRPHAALCVWAVAAASEAQAERLFAPRALWRIGRDRGVYAPLPTQA
jgi:alkanesulfonate monooxygenase SsuD/methylene tetrahydromethanopterin reductase-like flavin-dependent oxidoreductase (luciferase family)